MGYRFVVICSISLIFNWFLFVLTCFMRRWSVGVMMLLIIALACPSVAQAARKKSKQPVANDKYAALVIDADTGEVLKADHADSQRHPASLTKMMTMLMVFDALAEKRLRLTDYIRISNHAATRPPSKIGIRAGGKIRVDDALRSVSVKSANDIAAAVAEAIAGSESRFAQRMNVRARSIGMKNTHFVNASGLHSPYQVTTARDMAVLARYLIATYPSYYRYFGVRSFSYGGRTHNNHNKLLGRYDGMDGMKTGYISQSGFNLVASVRRGDRRLIGVVFGGRTGRSRDDHMASILDAAFAKPPKLQKPKIETAALPSMGAGSSPVVSIPPAGLQMAEPSAPSVIAAAQEVPAVALSALGTPVPPIKPARMDQVATVPTPGRLGVLSVPASPAAASGRDYTAQIGAYQSRDATDRALYLATRKLPPHLSHVSPIVAPLKSMESGWLFRARLGNLSRSEAQQVCQILPSCLILAPDRF